MKDTRIEIINMYLQSLRQQERADQSICGTGIRVSELRFVTAEAVRTGRVQVYYKCKCRAAFLPEALRQKFQSYLKVQKRTAEPVFVTKTGRPLDH